MILNMQYKPTPDGLGGNDDAGQMSAWYIFSSLGFYPVSPGNNEYAIGSPAITSATLHLQNGKTFSIEAKDQSDKKCVCAANNIEWEKTKQLLFKRMNKYWLEASCCSI
jgi:putative alpha-1,2-mannosidase